MWNVDCMISHTINSPACEHACMLLLFSVTSHILWAVLLQYYASFDLVLATYVALYISDNSAVS